MAAGPGVAGRDEYCMGERLHNAALFSQKFKALNNNEAPQRGRRRILPPAEAADSAEDAG